MMARAGLPVTLVSGFGAELSDALVSSPELGAFAFVGGRSNGRATLERLADFNKRHILEQEGLNAWGIWDFSKWDYLAPPHSQRLRVCEATVHRLPAVCRTAKTLPCFS